MEASDRSPRQVLEAVVARARALAEVRQSLAETAFDYDETLRKAARLTAELIGESCAVSLIGEDRAHLTIAAFHHVDPNAVTALHSVTTRTSFHVEDTIAGRVALSGRPLFLPAVVEADLRAAVSSLNQSYLDQVKVSSMMVVPLRHRGEALGAIAMTRATPDEPYTPADLTFLLDLASRVSSAIANARMFARLKGEVVTRLRAELELTAARDRLSEADRLEALGRFSVAVARNFSNLLGAVGPLASLCLEANLSASVQADLGHRLGDLVRSGSALTQQLLALGSVEIPPRPILNLASTVAGVSDLFDRLAPGSIEVVVTAAPDTPAVLADASQIEQIIVSLVVNARDTTAAGGRFVVALSPAELSAADAERIGVRAGRYALLRISDSEGAFFFTSKADPKSRELGLSWVHRTVRQLGGGVEVEAQAAHHTSFSIYLPASGGERPVNDDGPVALLPVVPPLRSTRARSVATAARRILHVQGYALRGGCETNGAMFIKHAAEHDHEIIVLGEEGPMSEAWAALGARVAHLRLLKRGALGAFGFLAGLDAALRRTRPSAVVVWTGIRVPLVLWRLARLSCPVVLHAGNPYRPQERVEAWLTAAEQLPVPERATVICCSEQVRQSYAAVPYYRRLKLEIGYNPIEVPPANPHVVRALGRQSPVRIGMVARLDPIKDHATVLRAFALVRRTFPAATLLLAGEGSERGRLEGLARELGLDGRVEFLGSIGDVPELLRSLDLFVYATTPDEGLGNALIEALAHGLPSVVTDLPVMREAVGDPPAARLCPPRDMGAFAAAMIGLIEDAAARRQLSNEAHRHAGQRFDARARTQTYLDALGLGEPG